MSRRTATTKRLATVVYLTENLARKTARFRDQIILELDTSCSTANLQRRLEPGIAAPMPNLILETLRIASQAVWSGLHQAIIQSASQRFDRELISERYGYRARY